MNTTARKFSLIGLLLIAGCVVTETGQSKRVMSLDVLTDQSSMNVWYEIPNDVTPDTPIVFVMHGVLRNADVYRDNWISLANEYNFIVVVPEFDNDRFPGSRSYNLGNLRNEANEPNSEDVWSFSVINRVFHAFKKAINNQSEKFYIFGHSAGSQFVHRLMMFKPDLPVALAIAANAGWYTMPTDDQEFPYGLKSSGTEDVNLNEFFATQLVILLGDQDTDPKDQYLRTTPEANLQGAHRFARGNNYFNYSQQKASQIQSEFNWQLVIAPGIAHENAKMAPFAAELISKHMAIQ